jgi:hypothetical protein
MKKVLLWDPRFPARAPERLTLADDLASAAVRAGVAAAADPAEQGALASGGTVSSAFPVEVLIQHGTTGSHQRRVTLPLEVAQIAVAAGTGVLLPVTPVSLPGAFVSADTDDFIISPVDGQQLMGA